MLNLAQITRVGPILLATACAGVGAQPEPADTVTTASLLREMVTPEANALPATHPYRTVQYSSYDRASGDGDTWGDEPYANWDRNFFQGTIETKNGTEMVMMRADGPGAIVRFWATWAPAGGDPFSDGIIRFYFDGSDEPAIEGQLSDIIGGDGLAGYPFSYGVSPVAAETVQGRNLYLPIPFADGCVVTYQHNVPLTEGGRTGESVYYQINARLYEPGTPVQTFSPPARQALRDAATALLKPPAELQSTSTQRTSADNLTLRPGVTPLGTSGGGILQGASRAITRLSIRFDPATFEPEQLEATLRAVVLEIDFDGVNTVRSPIGDFFGIGYRATQTFTARAEVTRDFSMVSRWVMPFDRSCEVRLVNTSSEPIPGVGFDLTVQELPQHTDMRFHALWREDRAVDTLGRKSMDDGPARTMPYIAVQGRGVYVGDTLTIFNAADAWWGEGDERISIDGEPFPSHFGTGTEDYYGYAWCRPERFSMPFHAQADGSGNLAAGHAVNTRVRGLDAIPFETSLNIDMELWHWTATKVNFARVVYFYAEPDALTDAPSLEEVREMAARPVITRADQIDPPVRVPGVLEAETLERSTTGGATSVQRSAAWGFSNGQQVWWTGASEGDTLRLVVPVEHAAQHDIALGLTSAPDYARLIVRFRQGDAVLTTEFDGFAPAGVEPAVLELGRLRLSPGDAVVEIQIVGSHPEATPSLMAGVDWVRLTPSS